MNKRITSLFLCFVMVFAMLTAAVPAMAATITSTQLKVTPDKTTVSPGDIITYTITMGPVSDMGSMQMCLDIPTGLTYVANSTELAENLKTTLGFDLLDWTETPSRMINGGASAADYESDADTVLATFQCKVDDDAAGSLEVGLTNLEFGSCQTFEYHTDRFSVVKTPVTITAAPKPATNITLNKSTTTIYTGGSETLFATVSPTDTTDTMTWESSKTSVATVDSTGKVSAVAPGEAVITVKAGSVSASCTVTVEDAPCTHADISTVSAKSSNCTEAGWDAYKKCDSCGQLFDTAGNEISEIPYRSLAAHTGGSATCKDKAVCTVCGQPYGTLAPHSYTAQSKTADALKSAGTCKDVAVYYYSCSVCGAIEHNDAHTFNGDKDAANHVGGTYLKNQKEANCKEDGYTGDTHCIGCDQKLSDGSVIGKTAHSPASVWSHDEAGHWKECTNVVGCGVKLTEGSHTSTGANVASCQHKAVCDVCSEQYGEKAAHNPASAWSNDASGHWHACLTEGCTEKCDFSAHTPDHEGHATEEYAIKCTECGYVIEAQLGHTHVFDKEAATDAYKATDATCTAKATYYKSCACGEKGTETFDYGEVGDHSWTPATCTTPKTCTACGTTEGVALGHTESTEWKFDENNHWHICSVAGCGVVIESSKATHTFEWKIDKEATATEAGSKHEECALCGYKKSAVEIPATGSESETTAPNETTVPNGTTAPSETTVPNEITAPGEPDKPENTTNPENSDAPQTGDNSMTGLWIALLLVGCVGLAGTTVFSRKRRSTR